VSENALGIKFVVRVSKHRGMWRAESSRCCRHDKGYKRPQAPWESPIGTLSQNSGTWLKVDSVRVSSILNSRLCVRLV
jgi:hypothetical protein